MTTKLINILGQKYGDLIVIKLIPSIPHAKWLCKCKCGNEIIAEGWLLRSGRKKNCGCTRGSNLIGQRFGKLMVFEKIKIKGKRVFWKCKCDCGAEINVSTKCLMSNTRRGCQKCQTYPLRITKSAIELKINKKYGTYKTNSRKKKQEFTLTKNEFANLIQKPCYYCGEFSKEDLSGLDRTNNSKGYIINNVVPCCKRCNYFKGKFNIEDFLSLIDKILKNIKYNEVY